MVGLVELNATQEKAAHLIDPWFSCGIEGDDALGRGFVVGVVPGNREDSVRISTRHESERVPSKGRDQLRVIIS